jgi:photosystem II stability/assembly factor-like uncharacterized protein
MHRRNKFARPHVVTGLVALGVIGTAAAWPAWHPGGRPAAGPRSGIAAVTAPHNFAGHGRGTDATAGRTDATAGRTDGTDGAGAAAAGAHPVLSPISASFISASTGWLLARPPCAAHGCTVLRLRKTTDGGRRWFAVPVPPALAWAAPGSPADAVSEVLFANASDGWLYGPGLWVTHDGGANWHRVRIDGRAVFSLAAGLGRVIAAPGRAHSGGVPGRFRVYTSPVGRDGWRPVPGGAVAGAGDAPASVVVSGHRGYVVDTRPDLGKPILLAGPADGSASWQALRNPCRGAWSAPLAAARGGWLVLGCGTEPGAGNQVKPVYLSHNQGRTWHRLTDPPTGGYLGQASITTAGTIFASGGRSNVYISWNGGRTWRTSRSLFRADIADGLGATAVSRTQDYVLQASLYAKQIWFSYDDGHTWQPVTVR